MKKPYLLSGIIALSTIASIYSMVPQRPKIYTMIDSLVEGLPGQVNWPAVFVILDSMEGTINVNEYRAPGGYTLLEETVINNNFLVTKELLEKYKANPNVGAINPLIIACARNDIPMVKLLLLHGANPYITDYTNRNSFDYAIRRPKILELLASYIQ